MRSGRETIHSNQADEKDGLGRLAHFNIVGEPENLHDSHVEHYAGLTGLQFFSLVNTGFVIGGKSCFYWWSLRATG
jgi:hypothetical protein